MAVQVLSGHGPDPLPNRTEGATGRSHCLETGEERHSQSLQSISPHPLPWFRVESRVPGACASAFALPAWATVRVTPSPSGSWPQVIETKELVLVCSCQAIESKGVPYRDRRGGHPRVIPSRVRNSSSCVCPAIVHRHRAVAMAMAIQHCSRALILFPRPSR